MSLVGRSYATDSYSLADDRFDQTNLAYMRLNAWRFDELYCISLNVEQNILDFKFEYASKVTEPSSLIT